MICNVDGGFAGFVFVADADGGDAFGACWHSFVYGRAVGGYVGGLGCGAAVEVSFFRLGVHVR